VGGGGISGHLGLDQKFYFQRRVAL